MQLLEEFGACDCHSHVFGPFGTFPLSPCRTFDPPEASIEELEYVWNTIGVDRAVLVQGSAHGNDHRAMLAALERSPTTRRGVALLSPGTSEQEIVALHQKGIRAVRLNWISHLPGGNATELERLAAAAALSEQVAWLGWSVEIHVDAADLDILDRLVVPAGMPVVIDHMGRVDVCPSGRKTQAKKLMNLMEKPSVWVKLSGADRLTLQSENLREALGLMRTLLQIAPDRCIWGLDWPHINLAKMQPDVALAELLIEATGDEKTLRRVLVENPARLYDFRDCAA